MGIILSIAVLVVDTLWAANNGSGDPYVGNPVVKVCVVMAAAASCYAAARWYRAHMLSFRSQLIQKPMELGFGNSQF